LDPISSFYLTYPALLGSNSYLFPFSLYLDLQHQVDPPAGIGMLPPLPRSLSAPQLLIGYHFEAVICGLELETKKEGIELEGELWKKRKRKIEEVQVED